MFKWARIAQIPTSRPAHGNAAYGAVSEFTPSCKNPRNALENPSARGLLLLQHSSNSALSALAKETLTGNVPVPWGALGPAAGRWQLMAPMRKLFLSSCPLQRAQQGQHSRAGNDSVHPASLPLMLLVMQQPWEDATAARMVLWRPRK